MHAPHKPRAARGRRGVTLVEVLVAIFVMAIGLLTLLALFPLGVLTMAQAIQDDRTSNAAANAAAIAIAQDIRHDPSVMALFSNPAPNAFVTPTPDQPSLPVYVDPLGTSSYLAPYSQWVGGGAGNINGQTFGIPRSPVSFVTSSQLGLQWFSLLDDIVFDTTGTTPGYGYPYSVLGQATLPTTFERNNDFTWAYLMRRPLSGDPTVVETTVVVYYKRSLALNSSLEGGEAAFSAVFNPDTNVISVSWTAGSAPNLRVGNWVLDATPIPAAAGSPQPYSQMHSAFYRVVGITETSDTSMDLEVQSPLAGFTAGTTTNGTIVVMDDVAEVFDKRTGWHP
jgi:prepilin-type N-terminal cleavage/methylation domain-containing protein